MTVDSLTLLDDSGRCHPVKLRLLGHPQLGPTPPPAPVFETPANAVFETTAEKADWIGAGQAALSRVPTESALPLRAGESYAIEGHIQHSGFGIAVLRVHEYDDRQSIATHKVGLEAGPFRLKFQASPATQTCALSVGLRGACRVELAQLRLRQAALDDRAAVEALVQQRKQPIFILGCGRSGTTMIVNMLRCFADTYCHLVEQPWEYFTLLAGRPETNLIVKRTSGCYQRHESIPPSVRLLYMVRHPFDVLSSKLSYYSDDFYVSGERWLAEWQAYHELVQRRPDTMILRYEDVVSGPAAVQERLEREFGLRAEMPMSNFHELAKSDPPSRHQAALEGARRPDTKSVGKWNRDETARRHVAEVAEQFRDAITNFLETFGYNAAADWRTLRGETSAGADAA